MQGTVKTEIGEYLIYCVHHGFDQNKNLEWTIAHASEPNKVLLAGEVPPREYLPYAIQDAKSAAFGQLPYVEEARQKSLKLKAAQIE